MTVGERREDGPRELCLHGVRETEECPECGFGWTPATPAPPEGGTETNCPLEGVHEHVFRGPHRFREWEPGDMTPREDGWEELRRLAEAATPGPWHVEEWGPDVALDGVYAGDKRITRDFELTALFEPADAAYIAAVSPDVVLRLLAAARGEPGLRTALLKLNRTYSGGKVTLDADAFDDLVLATPTTPEPDQ